MSFLRKQESFKINMIKMPDQVRHDKRGLFTSLSYLHHCILLPGSESGTCFVRTDCSWSDPFPPQPPPARIASAFVRLFLWYLWVCLTPRFLSSLSYSPRILSADHDSHHHVARNGVSRFPRKRLPYMHGVSDHAEPVRFSRYRFVLCCLPDFWTSSALRLTHFSRLNTRPVCSPVNASPVALRLPAHDSGSLWFAKPSMYGTFIHYLLPVLTGAPKM